MYALVGAHRNSAPRAISPARPACPQAEYGSSGGNGRSRSSPRASRIQLRQPSVAVDPGAMPSTRHAVGRQFDRHGAGEVTTRPASRRRRRRSAGASARDRAPRQCCRSGRTLRLHERHGGTARSGTRRLGRPASMASQVSTGNGIAHGATVARLHTDPGIVVGEESSSRPPNAAAASAADAGNRISVGQHPGRRQNAPVDWVELGGGLACPRHCDR